MEFKKKKSENLEIIAPDFFDFQESTPSPRNKELTEESISTEIKQETAINTEIKKKNKSLTDRKIENSKIVRPNLNIKIQKRSLTTSISGIRKKINKKVEIASERKEEQNLSSSKFSEVLLQEKWLLFAENRKLEGKLGLHTTLTKSKPILNDDFSILFVIDSEVQRMELQLESQSLLDFLRSELNNGLIQLKLEVTAHDKPKLSQLTSKERFFQMAEKNPDLHLLKEKFNLDIEY